MKPILKSQKLDNVCYDIRGPVLELAQRMEEEGHKIIKLNIGNVGVFGFDPPEEIQLDMIRNLSNASAYSDSKGIFAARKAIMQYCQEKGIQGVALDDVYTGNGVSELIVLSMNALLNDGDEVLVPAPDYPLWTAAVSLSGGTPVHYLCDESKEWAPDLADLRKRITPRTKAIVVINPNNPTGAIYSKEVLLELNFLENRQESNYPECWSCGALLQQAHHPAVARCDHCFQNISQSGGCFYFVGARGSDLCRHKNLLRRA